MAFPNSALRRAGPLLFCALLAFPALAKSPATKRAKAAASAPLSAPVQGASVEGITEYSLANGLRVLLFPDPSQATMTVNITYLVGSRNESYGETGMAHLLEHLQFKGTDLRPDVPKILNSLGARFNGSTEFDRTNYFVNFPASEANLDTALSLEADRMVNSHIWKKDLWDEKAKKGEMTVVRNEMEAGENDPIEVTSERMASVAYDWHSYGKSVIGARSDVENVNIEHLQAFYHRYYQPDNAVLMVAGKIDPAKTLAQINEKFGRIPRPARVLEKTWTVEPVQDGERSVVVRRIGGVPFLGIGYHVPQSASPDDDALGLVGQILESAPSGRLYKALVESKLAARVSTSSTTTLEPGFFQINVELSKDGDLATARAAALGVVEGFHDKPITAEELERARNETLKSFELLSKRTDSFAIALSEAIAAGDWRLFFLGRDNVEKMTLAQVQSAAEHYFKPSNRTVGEYIPTEAPDRAEIPPLLDIAALVKDYKGHAEVAAGEAFDASPKNIDARTLLFTAKNGMKGALLPKRTKGGTVSLSMGLHFGTEDALMNLGIVPELTAQMLLRGTRSHTRQELKDAFDKLQSQVAITGGAESARVQLTTDRAHLAAALALLGEVLKSPSFPAGELATLRAEQLASEEENRSEPQTLAFTALQVALDPYPKGHPNSARTTEETIAELKAAQLAEVQAFHSVFYGANHGEVAVVGDFEPKEVQAQLEQLFGDWSSSQPYAHVPARAKPPEALNRTLQAPDKANAFFIALETIPMKDSDPDYPAFELATQILGGGALKSRLADRIRQQEGISYGVGAQFQGNPIDPVSTWLTYAIYAPENLSRLETAFQEELERAKKGFTAEELAFSKNVWLQGREVQLAQDGPLARHLADDLYLGRTLAFEEALEAKVSSLTLEQVNAADRKELDTSKLAIFKAGDFNKGSAAAVTH